MYFWVNTYIIQTAGFTYIQIQTCRVPDAAVPKQSQQLKDREKNIHWHPQPIC
jgi:hypothetical protein